MLITSEVEGLWLHIVKMNFLKKCVARCHGNGPTWYMCFWHFKLKEKQDIFVMKHSNIKKALLENVCVFSTFKIGNYLEKIPRY